VKQLVKVQSSSLQPQLILADTTILILTTSWGGSAARIPVQKGSFIK